ncbi:hypothetical protein BT93_F1930 [Corymbia citriodora subsp. variegata]|nr:hypothetical protein BT93_F1930 [Corymbia citriodora subsp. variegata]
MDVAFRDSSAKGLLWEEVSRKLSELGYHRSAKKCKEKFENVYKYHKRTKDGRTGKHEGKTYRFFDQLEAFENHTLHSSQPLKPPALAAQPPAMQATIGPHSIPKVPAAVAVPSSTTHMNSNHSNSIHVIPQNNLATSSTVLNFTMPSLPPPSNPTGGIPPPPNSGFQGAARPGEPVSMSTSSSTFSDEGLPRGGRPNKRKRRWRDFFERVMKDVMDKQEELHRNFLETIDRRERERAAREEAWWMQETARVAREREILAQERLATEAKDAAVMSFLQKMAEQQGRRPLPAQNNNPPLQHLVAAPISAAPKPSTPPPPLPLAAVPSQVRSIEVPKADNGVHFATPARGSAPSSSRWPKVEVEALIRLRTNLDSKYQENGPKGPLWEDISAAMRRLGYERSAKRCKEKWENINKYFKKVKESNKKRREDSKTCPTSSSSTRYTERGPARVAVTTTALRRCSRAPLSSVR